AAEHLAVGRQGQSGQVEEGEGVAVAEVEEEVRRAGVVAVLEHLDQGEAEQAVVELDGALDVTADQGDVVHATGGARRPLGAGTQVPAGDVGATGCELGAGGGVDAVRLAHAVAHTSSSAPSAPAVN